MVAPCRVPSLTWLISDLNLLVALRELLRERSVTRAAERMGVTKSRVSQIERGEVSTIETVARYVQAIGGRIQISAVFGDDLYILRGTVTEAA